MCCDSEYTMRQEKKTLSNNASAHQIVNFEVKKNAQNNEKEARKKTTSNRTEASHDKKNVKLNVRWMDGWMTVLKLFLLLCR